MTSARPSTSRRRCATRAGKPDSSFNSRSCSSAARSRRSLETENIGTSPTSSRWPRSISSTCRHCGYRSVLASTAATFGEMRMACLRNCTSGSVYSCEASETSSTACAVDSADRVARALDESNPPTPGESTSFSPPLRISRGSITSAESRFRSLEGLPCSETNCGRSSSAISRRSAGGAADRDAARDAEREVGRGACAGAGRGAAASGWMRTHADGSSA